MGKPKKLTTKEQLFCIEYCSNGSNGTRAAIAAGYSEKTAKEIATQNLSKLHIQAEINRLRGSFEELAEKKGITRMAVLMKHWEIANSSIAHLHNTWIERKEFELLTDEQKACISEISTSVKKMVVDGSETPISVEYVKIKLCDKQKALDSISKMMGYDAPIKSEQKIEFANMPDITIKARD
jgi:phage terminase small subunit